MPYKVPFVDVPTHFLSLQEEILETVRSVLMRGNLILRDDLRLFENNLAAFVGTTYAVGVNSGSDALHLTLRALGIGQGDEVISVSHTCVATISAIVHAQATPVLVDVEEDFTMDMTKVEEAITPRTRAIVPVHLNGRACDMERLADIARRHRLLIVEDAAQALGAEFNGHKVGSFGIAGCFSLYPFKMLGAFGDGGIVTTNDRTIAREISILRDYGEDRQTGEVLYFGFNSRLDNLQAAILNVKLQHLDTWIRRRRDIADLYRHGLGDIPQLRLPHFPGEIYGDVYMNYAVRAEHRDELVRYLKKGGVEPLTPLSLITPIHKHKALGLDHVALPMTEMIAKEFLYLPICPELSDHQIQHVISSVREFYQERCSRSAYSP
ncbi:MAG TPA: DegT/DnrJ/EryC1/StrS family aminotransferase [Nitrospiraceae bacterium]|nr:DegT/DnrJ/EryC1/StrS family aminotransferase [Nitrospiraceae bacterium]